jgi:hypothetical protein
MPLEKTIKRQVFPQAPSPVVAQYVRPHEPDRQQVWVVSFRRVWFDDRRISDRMSHREQTKKGNARRISIISRHAPFVSTGANPKRRQAERPPVDRREKGICLVDIIVPLPVRRPSRMSIIRRISSIVVARPALSHSLFSRLIARRPRVLPYIAAYS